VRVDALAEQHLDVHAFAADRLDRIADHRRRGDHLKLAVLRGRRSSGHRQRGHCGKGGKKRS
jgi:hypothetical protein